MEELLEKLADLEHQQWEEWSKSVADEVSEERRARWETFWVPYEQLDEKTKDMDREYARKIMELVQPLLKDEEEGAQKALEMVTKVDAQEYPNLAAYLAESSLDQVLSSEPAQSHCHSTWSEGMTHFRYALSLFAKAELAMNQEDYVPQEIKDSLSSLHKEAQEVSKSLTAGLNQLAEVDNGGQSLDDGFPDHIDPE